MIRSMSDEQMQLAEVARHGVGFDKHPYASTKSMARFATLADVPKDETVEYLPRPECIPSPDPEPWILYAYGARHNHRIESVWSNGGYDHPAWRPRPWGTFTPDPEFVRSEVNPILSNYRQMGGGLPCADAFIGEIKNPRSSWWLLKMYNFDQMSDALKILTKLRNVTEASNA